MSNLKNKRIVLRKDLKPCPKCGAVARISFDNGKYSLDCGLGCEGVAFDSVNLETLEKFWEVRK